MVKRIGTARRKTRGIFSLKHRLKSKISIRAFLQKFNEGDKVLISVSPNYHSGMPYRRFIGKSGVILGKQGSVYKVKVKDFNKEKIVLVHPVHLKKVE